MFPPQPDSSLGGLVRLYLRHRQLTWEMMKRDLTDRFAGQLLGPWWAIAHPLFLMVIYAVIFSFLFSGRAGGEAEFPFDYPVYVLSGLIPWLAFQEGMSKGTTAVVANASLVKQVVFPLEILPVKGLLSPLLTQLIGFLFLIFYVLIKFQHLPWTYILLPFLFVFQLMAMAGISYVFSAVGSYFRDLKDIVQIFNLVSFYCIPIFYFPHWLPSWIHPVFYLNPFSYMVWCYQDACFFGRFAHPWAWPAFAGLSLLSLLFGYRLFYKLKSIIGNIL